MDAGDLDTAATMMGMAECRATKISERVGAYGILRRMVWGSDEAAERESPLLGKAADPRGMPFNGVPELFGLMAQLEEHWLAVNAKNRRKRLARQLGAKPGTVALADRQRFNEVAVELYGIEEPEEVEREEQVAFDPFGNGRSFHDPGNAPYGRRA